MRTVPGHQALDAPPHEAVVAIGNFDGVHVGHQQIFRMTVESARARGGEACVLTFEPHPAKVLAPALAPPLILPLPQKIDLIAASSIDLLVLEPFDRDFAALSPEGFIEQILVRALSAKRVIVGEDFTYGRARAGTTHTLRQAAAVHGFDLQVVEKVAVQGLVASSSKIREFVLEGRVDGAAVLLGRPYALHGVIVRGHRRAHGEPPRPERASAQDGGLRGVAALGGRATRGCHQRRGQSNVYAGW
jgi:riboflavin kinase/FMN adenylyltransferase